MEPGHEGETPATPRPKRVDAPSSISRPPSSTPTAESLLQSLAAVQGPWFPSQFAAQTGISRDSLDEPLAELRLAGLVHVTEWVKGVGQGYVLTPEGQAAARSPGHLEEWRRSQARSVPRKEAALRNSEGERDAESRSLVRAELTLRPPLVVPVLLIANVLWFFVCVVVGIRWGLSASQSILHGHPETLHRFGAITGTDLLKGEWWRLLTACFVHIGIVHLIGNMLALAMMGALAELLWGRLRLLLIYLIAGLAGSAVAMALRPESTLAGASGAIWGVQMSLFAWLFAFRRHLPGDLASDWFRRLTFVFLINAGVSFLPHVSWEGHFGGGVAGFLAAGLLNAARFGGARRRKVAWLLLVLLPVLFVGGLAVAMDAKGSSRWQQLRHRFAAQQQFQDDQIRRHKYTEAVRAFNEQVEPRLEQLAPQAIQPVEQNTLLLLSRTKRPAEQVKATRTRIAELKAAADEVVQLTTTEPSGSERFDLHREHTRTFAAARARSLGLLAAMLDTPGLPRPEAWSQWKTARHEADRLWGELIAKR